MTDVTVQTLQIFLEFLGRCYRFHGRLYLVGGSSLILTTAKESTLDIDVQFDVPPEHHNAFIHCLREISHQHKLSIESASPDQFIPLPQGYQNRHQYIGRFGLLDVFHFDFYSVALSKLYRGNEKDFVDVLQMIMQNVIDLIHLKEYFEEVLPQLESFKLSANPQKFERNFVELGERLSRV